MRLHLALAVLAAFVGVSLAFPFKLPGFMTGERPASGDPSYNVAPLLSSMEANVIPNKYIVVLKKDLHKDDVHAHRLWIEQSTGHYKSLNKRDSLGALFAGVKHMFNIDGLTGYAGHFDEDVIEKIRSSPEVAYVEHDQIVHTYDVQHNSPSWGLSRVAHHSLPSVKEYKDYEYDNHAGAGVTAYIIDTGINVDHQDFEGRAVWGKTIPEGDEDVDGNGHGTHVAGTVAGKTFGIAKKATVKAVKVLSSNGSGTMSDVIAGIEWAITDHQERIKEARALDEEDDDPSADKKKKKPKKPSPEPDPGNPKKKVKSVANMSLGGGRSRTLDRAVDAAVEAGIHFAVAAGNDARDACMYSPAASELAVTVGASTIDDSMAWFSNHGKCVDVFAPGRDITSSWIGSTVATNTISGTSMASPHVCGLLALFLSEPAHEDLTPADMKTLVLELATKNAITGLPVWSKTANKLIYSDPPSARGEA